MAFETSDMYKVAIKKHYRTSTVTGTLVTNEGVTIDIDNSSIDSGSLYVTNQCVNGDSFEYGSVFSAELGISLKTSIDRYSLYNAKITLSYNLLLDDGTYEGIPLGKFYVSDPSRLTSSVSIKAYDAMILFDKSVDENSVGTAYELLTLACSKVGVELAQTEEEIRALPNGSIDLTLDKTRVATYRDLISYIALITCTFAVIDRTGKLKLCVFETEPSYSLGAELRSSSKFSDFESFYSAISGKFLESGSYYAYTKSEKGSGLTYDIGEVPIVQGTPLTNQKVLDSIFEKLKEIKYTPCVITFSGDPSIDLGDVISNTSINGNTYNSIVTFYKWTYHGSEQIKSAGANPKLSRAKTVSPAAMSSIESELSKKSVSVYTYTNSKLYTVKSVDEEKDMVEVVRIGFASVEETTAIFIVTVPIELDSDGYVELLTYLDNVAYESSIVQYCSKGKSVITFATYIPCESNHMYRVSVKARTLYTESDSRINYALSQTNKNARTSIISAFTELAAILKSESSLPLSDVPSISFDEVLIDTSPPVGTISKFTIKAVVIGQGLAGKIKWDGTITFEEEINKNVVSLESLSAAHPNISAIAKAEMIIRDDISTIKEMVNKTVVLTPLSVKKVVEDFMGFNTVVDNYVFDTSKKNLYLYDEKFVSADDSFMLNQAYTYSDKEIVIDSGRLKQLSIDYTIFSSISDISVNAESTDEMKFIVQSSDGTFYANKLVNEEVTFESIDISELSASAFEQFGYSSVPRSEDLLTLENGCTVFCWNSSDELVPTLSATVSAVPLSQTVISECISVSDSTITGIEAVTMTCEGDVVVAVSFDEKESWKAMTSSGWVTLSDEFSGMSKDVLESITLSQWDELFEGATGFYIRVALTSSEQSITQIYVNFSN